MKYQLLESDYVKTPLWCAKDMINYFNPSGIILDPCRGENKVFYNNLKNSEWCEINEGVDFFEYKKQVDWIIGNPPYSIFGYWIKHSYSISKNIVYLLPTFKIFNALSLMRLYRDKGGIKHIRMYDVGKDIEWSRSRPIVACWFQRNYKGNTSYSYYKEI
jgi:hypothetical protein